MAAASRRDLRVAGRGTSPSGPRRRRSPGGTGRARTSSSGLRPSVIDCRQRSHDAWWIRDGYVIDVCRVLPDDSDRLSAPGTCRDNAEAGASAACTEPGQRLRAPTAHTVLATVCVRAPAQCRKVLRAILRWCALIFIRFQDRIEIFLEAMSLFRQSHSRVLFIASTQRVRRSKDSDDEREGVETRKMLRCPANPNDGLTSPGRRVRRGAKLYARESATISPCLSARKGSLSVTAFDSTGAVRLGCNSRAHSFSISGFLNFLRLTAPAYLLPRTPVRQSYSGAEA